MLSQYSHECQNGGSYLKIVKSLYEDMNSKMLFLYAIVDSFYSVFNTIIFYVRLSCVCIVKLMF